MPKNELPPQTISATKQKALKSSENCLTRSLNLQESAFRNFIENLPVMFYAVEPTAPYKPIYISPAFASLGYPLEDWLNNDDMWIQVLHPQDRDRILKKTKKAAIREENIDYEYRLIARDGTVRWVRDSGRFIKNENGDGYWQGIILDITTRKQAEASLVESEKRYRQMFEKNQAIKLLLDSETGAIVDANPAACKFYGYERDEFKTKKITEINTLPEKVVKKEIKKAKNEKRNYFIFPHRLANGEIRYVEIHSSAVRRKNQTLLYSIIHDVTERKRAEEALFESEAQYRNVFENANDLIYVHDLKGNYISVNQASERLFGYTREEALKMNVSQIVVPEHLELVRQMLSQKLLGAAGKTSYEVDCIAKDGSHITLEVNSNAIYKNGEIVAVQGIARDVTERKRNEKTLKNSEERYRDLFENANDLIYTHDLQENFTSLNRAGELITGYSRAEALNMKVSEVVAPEFLETARRMTASKVKGEAPTPYELEIIAKNGQRVSLEISTRLIFQNNIPIGVQGIGRNITERKRTEEALRLSERRFRFLSEGIMHQVWTATPDGNLDYMSRRALEYFGCTDEQMMNASWHETIHPEDLPECIERWNHSLRTGEYYEVEFRIRRADGVYRWHLARATAGLDSKGNIIKWFGTNTDIDDKKLAEEKLNHYALHDTLTNLPNRTEFLNHLKTAIKRSACDDSFRFAVLFLDLDRFKVINDGLGHLIGDKLLIGIAQRLKSCVRPGDVVARLGGDEFTILLNKTGGAPEVAKVAERLQEKLSKPFIFNNYEVFTSASVGIILSDKDHSQPEEYLRDADAAMYRAKESGKARYEIFDSEMHVRNINLLQLETDLRYAVERNELEVHYQPIVCLETGNVREFEALLRWRHPKHGLIAPNEFISVAEETGLIIQIGKWILLEACRQTTEWHKRFSEFSSLPVSVNLSAKQLMHPSLTKQVLEILQQTGLDPRYLKLEVTETTVMENSETALRVLSELRSLGVSLSTDDFGTGFSSLSYLHRFPFERLKIDRSFIGEMDKDKKSEAIVRTILMLGQNLNLEIVAEGIETERQLQQLRELGCSTGQGYFFSKPVDTESIEKLLKDNRPLLSDTLLMPLRLNDFADNLIEVEKLQ